VVLLIPLLKGLNHICCYPRCRYRLLAQIIVDEMRIMRMNPFRMKAFRMKVLGKDDYWFIPHTIEKFEEKTKYVHVLSARFPP
jgi:hypothetical protein